LAVLLDQSLKTSIKDYHGKNTIDKGRNKSYGNYCKLLINYKNKSIKGDLS